MEGQQEEQAEVCQITEDCNENTWKQILCANIQPSMFAHVTINLCTYFPLS